MKNPNIVRFAGLGFIVVLIAFGVFIFSTAKKQEPIPLKQNVSEDVEKTPSETTKTYTDESGFAFTYPDDITISKKDTTDASLYSSIAATSSAVPGEIALQVADTKIASVDAWIRKNIQGTPSAEKVASFGSMAGKEFVFGNTLTAVAINQGILFRLDTLLQDKKSDPYWQKVYQTILSGFSFVAPQAPAVSDAGGDSGDDIVVEDDSIE